MRKTKVTTCIMFDKTTFFLPQKVPIENFGNDEEIVIGNILLRVAISNRTKQIYYEGYFRTLRFTLYETGLYISNSLSALIYGHNANDITHKQLCYVVNLICDCINCSAEDLQIKDFEFGFTIACQIETKRILKHLISHRNQEAKQEYRQTKLTSVKFYHHNYSIKVYDKTSVEKIKRIVKIKGEWIRIEEQFKKKQIPKEIKTANDLLSTINIKRIFIEFLKQWQLIKKAPFLNHKLFSQEDIYRIYALQSVLYSEDKLDYVTKAAIKKEQQRFKTELEKVGDYSLFKIIERDFTYKFYALLNNEDVPNFPALLLAEKGGQIVNTEL